MRAAPWWNARRLGAATLLALGVAVLALGWVVMLRRQVQRQTEVIATKQRSEAVAEERQRIAREFHDTLEQELVALSLRLDTATAKVAENPLRTLLEGCRRLVTRLQSEGRDFIWNLREHTTSPDALRRQIEEATAAICDESETGCAVEVTGVPRMLKGETAHSLVRIAQEACANAMRHGKARSIRVSVSYGDEEVRLRVDDDGRGFRVTEPPTAAPGHFGLLGMHERMQKLGGRLAIESSPGKGTSVEAVVPQATSAS
jgi:signal transduction histidine kinase